jgi:hypothetical protein
MGRECWGKESRPASFSPRIPLSPVWHLPEQLTPSYFRHPPYAADLAATAIPPTCANRCLWQTLFPPYRMIANPLRVTLPSAGSVNVFGNRQMCLMLTAESSTDACCQLIGPKRSIGFNHPSFGMRPFGFNWIKPGTLDRQTTGQDAHPLTTVFHLAIVCPDPGGYFLADMPGGVIPYQSQDPFAHCFQPCATPFKKLNRDIADGTSVHETEQDSLVDLPIFFHRPQQQPVTSQCFWVWVFFGFCLFNQAQWLTLFSPGRQVELGKTAPPCLITIALDPIPIRVAPADQSVAAVFLRSYAGSGLVIQ